MAYKAQDLVVCNTFVKSDFEFYFALKSNKTNVFDFCALTVWNNTNQTLEMLLQFVQSLKLWDRILNLCGSTFSVWNQILWCNSNCRILCFFSSNMPIYQEWKGLSSTTFIKYLWSVLIFETYPILSLLCTVNGLIILQRRLYGERFDNTAKSNLLSNRAPYNCRENAKLDMDKNPKIMDIRSSWWRSGCLKIFCRIEFEFIFEFWMLMNRKGREIFAEN